MKDKTKRTWLIALGALVCMALIVGIGSRFGGRTATDPVPENSTQGENTPVVDITTPEQNTPVVNIDTNGAAGNQETKPGTGADSTGTEQTIQADPVKPEAPKPPTPIAENHDGNDVPEAERNVETPPTYTKEQTTVTTPPEPDAGSTNESGQVYVPGFGYVDVGPGNDGGTAENIYENGKKVGTMD